MLELKRKMMLTLFGLLSALSILLVAGVDTYSTYKAKEDLQSGIVSLWNSFNRVLEPQIGPWNETEEEQDSNYISLIYEYPVWVVYFGRDGNVQQVLTTDENGNSPDRIAQIAKEAASSLSPSSTAYGNPLTDDYFFYYPARQKMVLVEITKTRRELIRLILISIVLLVLFEVILYFVCLNVVKWMIGPIEESMRLQKQFIADASHELKTPVAVIQANAEAMAHDPDEKWLTNISLETERMSGLITDLLELARSESQPIAKENVNWSRVIEKQTMIQEARIFEKHLILEEAIDPDVFVEGQASMLEQIAAILLDNAIEHSDGKIRVTLRKTQKEAVFSVANTGMPIPPEIRKKIFERFYRADSSRNRSAGRYGLGLAIAKSLSDKHGGKIEADCKEGWTVFSVHLKTKQM